MDVLPKRFARRGMRSRRVVALCVSAHLIKIFFTRKAPFAFLEADQCEVVGFEVFRHFIKSNLANCTAIMRLVSRTDAIFLHIINELLARLRRYIGGEKQA